MTARHPTIEECEAAGRGPSNWPGKPYEVGGLPDTPEERARFEAYMRGHCWDVGRYIEQQRSYDTMFVRCCYGVWRDRGALPTTYGVATAGALPDPKLCPRCCQYHGPICPAGVREGGNG